MYTKELTKIAKKDEMILTVRAPVGELGFAQYDVCIGRGVCSINGDRFLYTFLEYFKINNKWYQYSQGSTFESVSGNEIRNIKVPKPLKYEQQKIGAFFSKLDQHIELAEQKVEQLKE